MKITGTKNDINHRSQRSAAYSVCDVTVAPRVHTLPGLKLALIIFFLIGSLAPSASADTLENLAFSGTATCNSNNTFLGNVLCTSANNGAVTGSYTLDLTTNQVVGSWAFSTPYGTLSSTQTGASAQVGQIEADYGTLFQINNLSFTEFISFAFPMVDTTQTGSLVPSQGYASSGCQSVGNNSCLQDFNISGSTSVVPNTTTTTPEPSSSVMLMGAAAVLGLALLCGKRF